MFPKTTAIRENCEPVEPVDGTDVSKQTAEILLGDLALAFRSNQLHVTLATYTTLKYNPSQSLSVRVIITRGRCSDIKVCINGYLSKPRVNTLYTEHYTLRLKTGRHYTLVHNNRLHNSFTEYTVVKLQ